jgi:hypothetical protein
MPKHSGGIKGGRSNNRNELVYSGNSDALDTLKYEIANEIGVDLGPDTSARANGTVGGLMTKTMIDFAQKHMNEVLSQEDVTEAIESEDFVEEDDSPDADETMLADDEDE